MASSYIFVAMLFGLTALASAATTYTTKYDTIDLDGILKSERLLNNYYKCLMDDGPCTPDGQELKKTIPDALKNKCEACTENQREGIQKVIRYLADKQPDAFLALERKYDPEGNYRKEFEEEAKKRGIALPPRKEN